MLDQRDFVTRLDPKGMLEKFEGFADQCREAAEIARAAVLPKLRVDPKIVMLTGLGGSAAGGDFCRCLFEAHGDRPFLVNRDYVLPNYIGAQDLVFCTSYSGNTEETLSAYAQAKARGAQILVVTSGGKLAEMAAADGYSAVIVPGGFPPRTALGYMMVPVLVLCERLGLLPSQPLEDALRGLDAEIASVGVDVPFESNSAKQLAEKMHGSVTLLYGLGSWQGAIANRWKGQINENAKNLAFPNAFPELNHNEILGWVKAGEQGVNHWRVVVLEDGSESEKMKARARVTQQLVGATAEFIHVKANGASLLERMLRLAAYGDFTSIYLAALNGIDPENIDSINILKQELGKIPG